MKANIIILFLIISSINLFATFIKEGDTVKDSKTKLIWQDNSAVKNNSRSWKSALSDCENLTLAGYSNSRLPNTRELLSIVNKSKYAPAIYSTFQNIASDYL